MPGKHAVLSPSAAKRWLTCPPSARLEEKLKERFGDKSSPFAEAGTQAHALAEQKLRREIGEINKFTYDEVFKQMKADRPEMDWTRIDWATDIYVDTVMEHYYAAKKTCPDAELLIEQRYDVSEYIPGCFGTSDAVVVSDDLLVVLDYKNGSGVPVSAVENPQARIYGLGATIALGVLFGFKKVKNVIVQPNLDSITYEFLTKEELLTWGQEINPIARLAWKGKGEYKAGDHCRFCAARALCYHRAAAAMQIFDTGMQNPGILPDEEIPRILEYADIAEGWIKDIRDYARSQALKGQHWNGFKLVAGRRPPRKWSDPETVVDQLSRAGYSDDQIYDKKLISVGDAEKLLGKAAFRAVLGEYSSQGEGAPTLVPESDKRPALNSAEAVFTDLV